MKDDVNKDVVLREPNGRWAKGTPSPSPGRPQGSRSQFSNEMLADMRASWAKNGPAAMQRTFEEQPAVYFRTMASIIPKDVALTVADQRMPGNLEPEAFAVLRRLLDVIQASGIEGDPQAVFERIEAALRADAATVIESVEK
jgi:hypothetical protein